MSTPLTDSGCIFTEKDNNENTRWQFVKPLQCIIRFPQTPKKLTARAEQNAKFRIASNYFKRHLNYKEMLNY